MSDKVRQVFGTTNPPEPVGRVQRFGSVVGLKPEMEQRYRELHAEVWQSVLSRLRKSNIRNYSIYITELENRKYLFSYLEYIGDDFEQDMQAMSEDSETLRWWQETDPCQIKLPDTEGDSNWREMEMLFHMD